MLSFNIMGDQVVVFIYIRMALRIWPLYFVFFGLALVYTMFSEASTSLPLI